MGKNDLETTTMRPVIQDGGARLIPCLEVIRGSSPGTLYQLREGASSIGRDPECSISLRDDGLSRRHAEIVVGSDGVVRLVDLRSTNGTYADGEKIESAVLREGASVQLGPDLLLRFGLWPEDTANSQGRKPKASPEETPLSKRELEVARLVAEGLSNQDIALRLHISARTVGAHLSNIYDRLGVRTRAKLTRWVLEQGLD